jgi:1-acyl-sn-glycerol-3-phosphate acyltransferase
MSDRPLLNRLWYRWLQLVFQLLAVALFRVRCQGRKNVPASGGALVLSNHQSHLDPPLIGLSCERPLNFMARDSLFHFAPLAWFMRSVGAFPIDRDGTGLSGLRETLKRLRHGDAVVIFPEGTRSRDGEVAPLKAGFAALAKRSRVPLVPVGIEGAFAAWPRRRLFPLPAPVVIVFGPPLEASVAAGYSDRELVAEVERRIRACHEEARNLLRAKC